MAEIVNQAKARMARIREEMARADPPTAAAMDLILSQASMYASHQTFRKAFPDSFYSALDRR